jgi:hypothetical protein
MDDYIISELVDVRLYIVFAPFFGPNYHTRISVYPSSVLDSRMDGPRGRDAVGIIDRIQEMHLMFLYL